MRLNYTRINLILSSSLNKNLPNYCEIVIVDNGCIDNSIQKVEEKYSDVNIIKSKVNLGYAGGCNLGAKQSESNLLLFLNNDTIQDPDWIQNLENFIKKDNMIAAVQPKVLNYFNKNIFDYAGGSGGHMDWFCFPYARGRIFSKQEKSYCKILFI